ncbi:ABC transporter permease [Candidatus Poribacteria bacterium]|nr:ABC transporter permease [Candidatus Poribacteria bacterium]MYA56629.1 ABC transporter permease [Candidatus Poribacteria bacterium]
MKLRDAITAGVKPLAQNKLRAGLSILGIFIGIAGVLCMIAIGDGAKRIIAQNLEMMGGANQIAFWTRTTIWKGPRRARRTTERYTLEDASAVEAECPDVLYVLPKVEDFNTFVSSRNGNQAKTRLEGITTDYALGMGWDVHAGRFFSDSDIENAKQVCVLGANTASELFGKMSPIGQEVKVRYHWRQSQMGSIQHCGRRSFHLPTHSRPRINIYAVHPATSCKFLTQKAFHFFLHSLHLRVIIYTVA